MKDEENKLKLLSITKEELDNIDNKINDIKTLKNDVIFELNNIYNINNINYFYNTNNNNSKISFAISLNKNEIFMVLHDNNNNNNNNLLDCHSIKLLYYNLNDLEFLYIIDDDCMCYITKDNLNKETINTINNNKELLTSIFNNKVLDNVNNSKNILANIKKYHDLINKIILLYYNNKKNNEFYSRSYIAIKTTKNYNLYTIANIISLTDSYIVLELYDDNNIASIRSYKLNKILSEKTFINLNGLLIIREEMFYIKNNNSELFNKLFMTLNI